MGSDAKGQDNIILMIMSIIHFNLNEENSIGLTVNKDSITGHQLSIKMYFPKIII